MLRQNRQKWQLKLKLAEHFMVGESETVEMQLDSRVIILLKQKDFCGVVALTYFVENCSDLPQQ